MNDITPELIQSLQASCPDVDVISMANRILQDPRVHSPAKCLTHNAQTAQALKTLTRQAVLNLSEGGQPETPPPAPPRRSILESAPWYQDALANESEAKRKLRAHEHAQRIQYREQDKAGEL